jgi:hypothetical protein
MSDTFKKVYTVMPDEIKETIFNMKSKAEELKQFFDKIHNREMSIAQTNLEQTMMWATKAWVNYGDKINATKEIKE